MVGGANLGGKEDDRLVLLDQVHLHPSMLGLQKDGKNSRWDLEATHLAMTAEGE